MSRDQIGCPFCTNGTVQEAHLTGDGQPNVPVEIHTETKECDFCDGRGTIQEDELNE